jgi:hypothetical protein
MYFPAGDKLDKNWLGLLHDQPNFYSSWPSTNDDLVLSANDGETWRQYLPYGASA